MATVFCRKDASPCGSDSATAYRQFFSEYIPRAAMVLVIFGVWDTQKAKLATEAFQKSAFFRKNLVLRQAHGII
jgi:hypothetical protein